MESVIKWRTGEPKENGYYLVSTTNGIVSTDAWIAEYNGNRWYEYTGDYFGDVIAWYPLSEIEPYKE